jgi:hypothetical protein
LPCPDYNAPCAIRQARLPARDENPTYPGSETAAGSSAQASAQIEPPT